MNLSKIALVFSAVLFTFSACGIEPQGGGDDGGLATPDTGGEADATNPAPDANRPHPRPDAGPAADATIPVDITLAADATPAPDATTVTPDAVVTPPPVATQPAPFRSGNGPGKMEFSRAYLPNGGCAEVLGDLPGMSWSSGLLVTDPDADGYFELNVDPAALVAGRTYSVYYRKVLCPNETGPSTPSDAAWGSMCLLSQMDDVAKAYLLGTWVNFDTKACDMSSGYTRAGIFFTVDATKRVVPLTARRISVDIGNGQSATYDSFIGFTGMDPSCHFEESCGS